DLSRLQGTGPGGRIVRADVEGAAQAPPAPAAAPAAAAAAAPTPGDVATAKGQVSLQELTRTQQVVARRMAEAKATVPEFTLQAEIDMERCVEMRAQLKEAAPEGPAPSFNDMIVKACALALREYP